MSAFFAEFFGTAIIIVFGGGVVANVLLDKTKGNKSGWIVITFGWAVGVFTGILISAPFSGAHLNPAVTLALVIAGKFQLEKLPMYICAQLLGAMFGALLVWLAYKKHFDATDDAESKLAVFVTAPNIRSHWNICTGTGGTLYGKTRRWIGCFECSTRSDCCTGSWSFTWRPYGICYKSCP
jgi:glycerol uptake facilitator protein